MRFAAFFVMVLFGTTACGSSDSDTSGSNNGGNGPASSTGSGAGGQGGETGSGGDVSGGGDASGGNGQGGGGDGGAGEGGGGTGSPCGDMGLTCGDKEICVAFHETVGPMTTTTYECHEDPCEPDPLSCDCAGKICTDKFNIEICSVDNNDVVNCDNGAICAAPDTPIATPDGDRPIASLRAGEMVYSMHQGRLTAVPIARVTQRAVSGHAVVKAQLDNGTTLLISGPHPTADGRLFSDLMPGSRLGEATVVSVATLPYPYASTHDILPASDSGSYIAGGALIGSTLR